MTNPKSATRPPFDEVFARLERKLVGNSQRFRAALLHLYRTTRTDKFVRIVGETGVGKEACAEFYHIATGRPGKLVIVNGPNINSSTAESDLFGHVKGSYTGALGKRPGLIAQAEKGTVFLDEVLTLSLDVQEKLLRLLEERIIRPLGADSDMLVDVRVVAATNEDLQEAVDNGCMKRDFFFRVKGIKIELPHLRDRGCDIIPLAMHFLRHELGEYCPTFSNRARTLLLSHDWPGNIRELRNTIENVALLKDAEEWQGQRIHERDVMSALETRVPLKPFGCRSAFLPCSPSPPPPTRSPRRSKLIG